MLIYYANRVMGVLLEAGGTIICIANYVLTAAANLKVGRDERKCSHTYGG